MGADRIYIELDREEAEALGNPFADPFRLRKQFETGRRKLRAALASESGEGEDWVNAVGDFLVWLEDERQHHDERAGYKGIHAEREACFRDVLVRARNTFGPLIPAPEGEKQRERKAAESEAAREEWKR